MSQYDFSQILMMIDEWVKSLEDYQLNQQCRQSGKSFFDFLKTKGCRADILAKIIMDATGYNPAQLWRIEDAQKLKSAIFSYESCGADIRYHQIEDVREIYETTEFWFRE
ncbi:hypothetical protein ACL6C3_14375 [Capilliphycus salinus ALCB114379]|uniref:hypothetical protein n=1 Tax=Capilliphycus salinus TaxID=2768948 RepID=UPI0039A636C5